MLLQGMEFAILDTQLDHGCGLTCYTEATSLIKSTGIDLPLLIETIWDTMLLFGTIYN